MMLPLSARFSAQRLPAKGQRVVYVSGPTMKGTGTVIALVPRKGGIYVRVMMDESTDQDGCRVHSVTRTVKVESLYEEPKP